MTKNVSWCTAVVFYNEELGFPGTDLTLVVEGRKAHVNKNVRSEHSAVFDTSMLNSKLKKSTAQEII